MGLDIEYEEGQTPLDPDEAEGLHIKTITIHSELNEAEQINIGEAVQWTLSRKFAADLILTEEFIRELHRRMYGDVWRWAGEFRKSDKSIGIAWFQISTSLRALLDDCKFWINHKTFSEDEIAVRFKHRIVSIHCFPNGNGRHSRLMADVLVGHIFGREVFSWGASENLVKRGDPRKRYLEALKEADKGNMKGLIEFARE